VFCRGVGGDDERLKFDALEAFMYSNSLWWLIAFHLLSFHQRRHFIWCLYKLLATLQSL